ncbi:glycosyltransferase [Priestia koreensis]|uniref:glycosyltransferase n=1 Tax=Priestia koreensis TaxID=284581 RepID=UPI0034592628
MITVVTVTNRDHFMENAFMNFEQQTWAEKELVVVLNDFTMDVREWKQRASLHQNVRVYALHESATLGECLNRAVSQASNPIISKFDDDDYYGPSYLTEVQSFFKKTGADVIGKATIYSYFKEDELLSLFQPGRESIEVSATAFPAKMCLTGATLSFRKEVLEKIPFASLNIGEDVDFQKRCLRSGMRLWSCSKKNYVHIRYSDQTHHSSMHGTAVLKRVSQPIGYHIDYKNFVN